MSNQTPSTVHVHKPQSMENGEFPKRLRQIIGDRSVRSFARHCGISDSVLRQYLRGKSEPTRPVLLAIACCTGVAVEWLATGSGPMKLERNPATIQLADGDFTALPHIVPANDDMGMTKRSQRLVKNFLFKSDWLTKEISADLSGLAMTNAHGNAMTPTIDDGDTLLVNVHQNAITKDGIYLLQVNYALVPRRIQVMLDGGLNISCDNPAYAPETIYPDSVVSLSIIGRVVWIGKKLP